MKESHRAKHSFDSREPAPRFLVSVVLVLGICAIIAPFAALIISAFK